MRGRCRRQALLVVASESCHVKLSSNEHLQALKALAFGPDCLEESSGTWLQPFASKFPRQNLHAVHTPRSTAPQKLKWAILSLPVGLE